MPPKKPVTLAKALKQPKTLKEKCSDKYDLFIEDLAEDSRGLTPSQWQDLLGEMIYDMQIRARASAVYERNR